MAVDAGLRTEVEAELARARDVSETRTLADLREATGAGHDDLTEVLDELREAGRISEVAPGEYLPFDSMAAAREGAAQRRQNGAAEVPEPGVSLREAESARAARTTVSRVVLPRAVAQSLDEAALGQIVKAGIDGADGDFTFEVTA